LLMFKIHLRPNVKKEPKIKKERNGSLI